MKNTNNIQTELSVEDFVKEYKGASDEDISKIIAGITAIIEGNEVTYNSLKNQKWFERIWFGLTRKNKATVEEMRAKRDELTKYTVQILIKMNDLLNEHSECIYDLYRALAVVRRDVSIVVDEVNTLAHTLNEKIISIDNYVFLINDIRNGKFEVNTPLISLVDIMSRIDIRTAQETKKLSQIKETMETMGFDFSKRINIQEYSEEVFSLEDESVGRVLLFCQSFSRNSCFLSFTCSLIANYFYVLESKKRLVRESGEAVDIALKFARINQNAYFVVGELFNDLEKCIQDDASNASVYKKIQKSETIDDEGIVYGAVSEHEIETEDYSHKKCDLNENTFDEQSSGIENSEMIDESITSIIHIGLSETKIYKNKNIHISAFINCEGKLYIDNSIVYYNESDARCGIKLTTGAELHISNSVIICKGYDENHFIKYSQTQAGNCNIVVKNTSFSDCSNLIEFCGDGNIEFDNCEIRNPYYGFVTAYNCNIGVLNSIITREHISRFNMQNCSSTCVFELMLCKAEFSNDTVRTTEEYKMQLSDDTITEFIKEKGAIKSADIYPKEVAINNCTFEGDCGRIDTTKVKESTFNRVKSYISSYVIDDCVFENGTNIISLFGGGSVSNSQFISCYGRIIDISWLKKNVSISFCQFINTKNVEDGILSETTIEISRQNGETAMATVNNCIFDGVEIGDGFLIRASESAYRRKPKGIVVYLKDCDFRNCSTRRQSGEIIKALTEYDTFWEKNQVFNGVQVDACRGLDRINKEASSTSEFEKKVVSTNNNTIGSSIVKVVAGVAVGKAVIAIGCPEALLVMAGIGVGKEIYKRVKES